MKKKQTTFLILGGGISGLTFANYVDDYLIVEKEERIGGYCKTTLKNGYVWDYAGHFFHFNTKEWKEKFINKIDKEDIIYKNKCTKIYYKGKLIDYPFQKNIHQLHKNEFIDCLYDLFTKEEKDKYNNFLDMLYGKFGKSITEKFLKPYNEKLYACDLKLLDTNAMGRFFPYADKNDIIKNMKNSNDASYNNVFLYPKKGAESFINIISKDLSKERIILNTKINNIDTNNKIAYSDNYEIHYTYLINTIPLNNLLNLLGEKYCCLKEELSYNQVLVFNLGFNKKSKFNQEHWIYFPDKKINFYRAGFYDNILDSDKLSMYIEIGYPKNCKITDNEIQKQLEETLVNLKKVGITDDTFKLEEYEAIIMSPAYVHIETKTEEKIKTLFKELETQKIYSIGRYGGWTYCSMEDSMIKAKSLANHLNYH